MINFYAFHKNQELLISDFPKEKIISTFGSNFEILSTIKEKESLDLVKPKIIKQYPKYLIIEKFYTKKFFSEETRIKLSKSKLGKTRDDFTKMKISQTMKGKSNFQGKNHTKDSRLKTSLAMRGNKNITSKHKYIYNPYTDEEKRVKNIINIPAGFRRGRDPEVIDSLIFFSRPSNR